MRDSAYSRCKSLSSFRELIVWQRSMDLAVRLHAVAKTLPPTERFELGRDLRRSSRSIPANIAEGFSRFSRASYRWHVTIALGSQGELETQVEMAKRLGLISEVQAASLLQDVDEVGRMLHGLRRALQRQAR